MQLYQAIKGQILSEEDTMWGGNLLKRLCYIFSAGLQLQYSQRDSARRYVRLGTQSTGFELIILACRGRISTIKKTKVKNFVFLSLASAINRASGVGTGRLSLRAA